MTTPSTFWNSWEWLWYPNLIPSAAQSIATARDGVLDVRGTKKYLRCWNNYSPVSGTFWDTVVVCALTGLVLVSSVIAHPDIDSTHGAALTHAAFSKLPVIGPMILSVGIVTFAFSTILGWSYYGERAVEYLAGRNAHRARRMVRIYRILWVAAVFAGSVISLSLVWNLAEVANAIMAVPNLLAVLLLSGVIVKETRKYLWSGRLDDVDTEEF